MANASAFLEGLPEGYRTKVGDGGISVSAGQKQRIALARAIYWNPRLLLLDEPTSALDAITEREIAAALRKIAEGRTLIVTAHRLTTVLDFSRIYVIANGRFVECGSHAELLENEGQYSKLWQAHSRGAEAPVPQMEH